MPFVLNITKSSRIAKREHGLKLQLIPMHAQYVNFKVNEVLFYFYSAGQPQDARVPVVLHRMWRIGKWLRTLDNTRRNISYDNRGGGGGSTPLYLAYRYVPLQRVRVLRRFVRKTGIDFAYFGLNSGMVFVGITWTYMSFQFHMNKKKRVTCEFEVDFKKSFSWRSNQRIVNFRLADTAIVPTAAKSHAKINFKRLTEINSR